MHVMFVHPAFPAQFGHVASYLATQRGWPCTFVTAADTSLVPCPFNRITYPVLGGSQPLNHLNHLMSVYRGLQTAPQVRPDLIVGHLTFGTLLLLRNLYPGPFVGYHEWLPPRLWGDGLLLRPEFPPPEDKRLASPSYHALTYLQLHAVDAAYTPTRYQLGTAPAELRPKVRVIHDGIDCDFFRPRAVARPTTFRGLTIPQGTRVVTYVARGLEATRGFDLFMKAACLILKARSDVLFLVAGLEHHNYGYEVHHLPPGTSFKQWVLRQDDYDLTKFQFLDWLSLQELALLFNLTDLHFYLTVPFVLSWSLLQAMASGCTILGSATAPVQEVIDDGVHGLLADFYDPAALAARALEVLQDPLALRPLGQAARARVLERYELNQCLNNLAGFFEQVANR